MTLSNNLITSQLIAQFPNMSKTAHNWISCTPECKWAQDYFSYLNKQLSCLKRKQQDRMIRKLVSPRDGEYYEAIAEIAYIALWNHLGWPFKKDPSIGGKTPDFKVTYDENSNFIFDVTVVRHNHPHKPIIIEKKSLCTDPIEQSHRFLMKIEERFRKYQQICISCNTPLVIAFFLYASEDQFYLDDFQLERALYGEQTINVTTRETYHQPKIMRTKHGESKVGILTFDEYKPLSAIIVCSLEFCRASNKLQQSPKPHYPLKAKLTFGIYHNPFGEWANKKKSPFPSKRSIKGLIDVQLKTLYGQEV